MSSPSIEQAYGMLKPRLEHLRAEALFALEAGLRNTDIKLHSITSRIKELPSIVRKAERRGYAAPLTELSDLVGLRVVCLFLSDMPHVRQVIERAFDVLKVDDKIDTGEAASFGYLSVHFDVALKATYAGPRYEPIAGMRCEIQVRTIAMDAWANVSHHLSYRSDIDVPEELRRDFYALSGLFYVADKHFEMFYLASAAARRDAVAKLKASSPELIKHETLNVDTLAAYLAQRYPDRRHGGNTGLSELLTELSANEVNTIGDLEKMLDRTEDAFSQYESTQDTPPGGFIDLGVVRVSLYLFSPQAFDRRYGATGVEPLGDSYDLIAARYLKCRPSK